MSRQTSTDGNLIIVSGFSGVGKGTVVRKLTEQYPDCVVSVSATTRKPREGEVDGKHYFFVSRSDFERMARDGQLLEYAEYVGNCYGTPAGFVSEMRARGLNVILEIEMQGAVKVKEKVPDAKMIFLLPPSGDTLIQRLAGRGTEKAGALSDRLKRAAEEIDFMKYYEYFVINDDLAECVENIRRIILGQSVNSPDSDRIVKIQEEILNFAKGEL